MDKREEFKKAKILHGLKNSFIVDHSTLETLSQQIFSDDMQGDLERFYSGYSIEDKCQKLFSVLPFVKLNHGLLQEQYPDESKHTYQVPDFCFLYETADLKVKPLLVETKSVSGQKLTLKLKRPQITALQTYATTCNIPILIAIFWAQYSLWTLNSIDQFTLTSSTFKISLTDAFANNLSGLLGDYNIIFPSSIYRKTIYDKSVEYPEAAVHEVHGPVTKELISRDGVEFLPLEAMESAVIDSLLSMAEIKVSETGSLTETLEMSGQNYMPLLSTLILRHLGTTPGLGFSEHLAKVSRLYIFDLVAKLNLQISIQIPKNRTTVTDNLFNEAFAGTNILANYLNEHKIRKQ
jgi:hypothetical protein